LGFRIKEVPIIFTDRTRGQSKMSKGIFREALVGVVQMKVSSWIHPPRRAADEPQGQPSIASAQ
ncbi:MAG: polyprenol monophosphomannose synthase, partial [Hymenobacter sp.]